MDAGIIVSSLIEKWKNIESTTAKNMIGESLHSLKEFLIRNNELFLQGYLTRELKMTRLLHRVYITENNIDTWLARREWKIRRKKLYEVTNRLSYWIVYLGGDDFETKELLEDSEKLLTESEELLREEAEWQRRREKDLTMRVRNCIERVKFFIFDGRKLRDLENPEEEKQEYGKQRKISQKERERLQKRKERLQKMKERLQKERESLQPSMRLRPSFSTDEMKDLEIDLQALCCQNENEGGLGFSFQTNFENYRAWERVAGFCLEETAVVGVEQQIEELVARLIPKPDGDDRGQSAQIIGVVGERGSGKTALARSVYNRVDVKQYFTQRAWVHASSVLKARDLLMDIINQIHPDGFFLEATISDEEVIVKLTQVLKSARHLIVIDDIEARQVSQPLQDALSSSSSHYSRIIITTRKNIFLPLEAAHSALRVRRLNLENVWKLFSKKALSESEYESKFIKFEEQILSLSGGLSLQVVALGSLLSTKDHEKWSKVIEGAITNFRGDMLALSYQDLPPQVKPCFLYLMLFPGAFEIRVRRLIHLWCAEGFTTSFDSHYQNVDPEDVAEMYFEELVIRNLIQVTKWRFDGRPKSCRIPRVVYDAFYQEASDLGFVHSPLHSSHTSTHLVRRLSLYLNVIKSSLSHSHHLRNVRSYVAFDSQTRGPDTIGIEFFLNSSIFNKGFSLLKVLDLEGVYKPEINYFVKKLLWLRYLGLRSTFIDYLSSTVWKLPDLETLDLKHTHIVQILRSGRPNKLQHLYLNWINNDAGFNLRYLKNLRTLWGLRLRDGFLLPTDDLIKLICLRKLGLKLERFTRSGTIFDWVSQLTTLQSLKLVCLENVEKQELSNIKKHYMLNDLYLKGRLLPQKSEQLSHFFPPSLRKLTLSLSGIEDDPMQILGKLPHLNILRLFADSYTGEKIECKSGEFSRLHALKLWKLQAVKYWIVEKEAMPCLREIELRSCTKMESIQGLENVTTLKDIVLTNMPWTSYSLPHHKDTAVKINQWRNSPY